MVKITTLFMGAFFCFVVAPGYIKAEKPAWETASGEFFPCPSSHLHPQPNLNTTTNTIHSVALCGIIPILFVTFVTSPFVTHIHIHLPDYARASRPILERYVKSLPPATRLTFTTMSSISKPRYSELQAGDLSAVRRRFGLVNYVRDTAAENARRSWYMFRAVGRFYVQERGPVRRARYEKVKKDKVDAWIWDAIKEKVEKKSHTSSPR